ncbi:predicted protein [Histoplasma mississippiense (nom. inval.)]|uniref:predicted protein n=1 Tax=Ajellomyces capsulatus (strain NAm1 / WU24) TaxID=2059318 RepID=UPI000157CABC|nr:predicted protein [Histoplasma mississippiense (nom. inval.)]EDN09537.1 predicted protein [Histoplasma mississippiense (nom. inval.)]
MGSLMGWLETGSDTCVTLWDRWDYPRGSDGPCGAVTGPWHNQGCDNALPFKGIVPMPQDYRIGNYLCCVATVANRFGSARVARHKGMVGKKRLRGAAAASVAAKRARLEAEAETPSSCGGSAPPPLPLSHRPPPPINRAMYDPAWSFGEDLRESLVPGTAAQMSPVRSSPPAERPSPAQGACGSGPQGSMVPLLSPCGETLVRRLAGTATCLRCAKQLREGGILCTRPSAHSRCFRCVKNNDTCLPVPKQYRAKVVDLQALADSVRSGEVPKARLEKEAKAWVSEVEKHFRMAGPKKKGSAGAAVGSATETNRLLERISLQLEQVTEVLCKLAKVPVPGTPSVEEEFGGGEVVEE